MMVLVVTEKEAALLEKLVTLALERAKRDELPIEEIDTANSLHNVLSGVTEDEAGLLALDLIYRTADHFKDTDSQLGRDAQTWLSVNAHPESAYARAERGAADGRTE